MAVAIDEMSVEMAPVAAAAAPAHGAGAGTGAGQADSAALHKMMIVLNERKLRLKTS